MNSVVLISTCVSSLFVECVFVSKHNTSIQPSVCATFCYSLSYRRCRPVAVNKISSSVISCSSLTWGTNDSHCLLAPKPVPFPSPSPSHFTWSKSVVSTKKSWKIISTFQRPFFISSKEYLCGTLNQGEEHSENLSSYTYLQDPPSGVHYSSWVWLAL